MNVREADRAFLVRDSSEDLQVVRSEGSYLFDERGRKYIDFLTGWNVGNFGWGSRAIKPAIKGFQSRVTPHRAGTSSHIPGQG